VFLCIFSQDEPAPAEEVSDLGQNLIFLVKKDRLFLGSVFAGDFLSGNDCFSLPETSG
jgi:hypothetical protein